MKRYQKTRSCIVVFLVEEEQSDEKFMLFEHIGVLEMKSIKVLTLDYDVPRILYEIVGDFHKPNLDYCHGT